MFDAQVIERLKQRNEREQMLINPKITRALPGICVWLFGWIAVYLLRAYLDLANLGMLLVIVSALGAMSLPWRTSAVLVVISVLAFDWFFIPPFYTFKVNIQQHLLLLLLIVVINLVILSLMAKHRSRTQQAQRYAQEAELLREWGDELNNAPAPDQLKEKLQLLLS